MIHYGYDCNIGDSNVTASYVLRSIGVSEDLAHTSVRFGISRFTTDEEIEFTLEQCIENVNRLREMSPLYEMWKSGDLDKIEWTPH